MPIDGRYDALNRSRHTVLARGHDWDVADVVAALDTAEQAQAPTVNTATIILLASMAASAAFGAGWAAHARLHHHP